MDAIRAGLTQHGTARLVARSKAKAESEAIAALAREAIAAGMTKAEICSLAQISRPALDTMLAH